MNSYFPNPFLSSLQGEGQPSGSTLPCNFGGLSGRYDHQQSSQSSLFCSTAGNPQGLTAGQFNHSTSPTAHHPHMTSGDPGGCGATRPTEINGYDQGAAGHLGSPGSAWSGQGGGGSHPSTGAGAQPSDYTTHNHHTPPNCSTENSLSCSTTASPNYASSQPIPFYPWMGVVGE